MIDLILTPKEEARANSLNETSADIVQEYIELGADAALAKKAMIEHNKCYILAEKLLGVSEDELPEDTFGYDADGFIDTEIKNPQVMAQVDKFNSAHQTMLDSIE